MRAGRNRVDPSSAFVLDGTVRLEVRGRELLLLSSGDFVLIPAAYDFTSSSTAPAPPDGLDSAPIEVRSKIFRLGDITAEPEVRMLASLARAAAMSRSAFFDRFRKTVGIAPMEYLLHWRMVLAKRILDRGQASVAEIARQVASGSASTFSVAFTRHVGTSPSLYARQQAAA